MEQPVLLWLIADGHCFVTGWVVAISYCTFVSSAYEYMREIAYCTQTTREWEVIPLVLSWINTLLHIAQPPQLPFMFIVY